MKKLIFYLMISSFLIILLSSCGKKTGPETIAGNGTIEATEVDISARIAGKIVELNVAEGDNVEKGKLIAKLDDTELTAAVAQAKAVVGTAKANLADLIAGARKEEIAQARANAAVAKSNWENLASGARTQEIDAAKAALATAVANFVQANKDWQRMQKLYADGAISTQERDAAKTTYDTALSQKNAVNAQLDLLLAGSRPQQIESAKNQYASAQKQLDLLLAGSRPETIVAARARLKQAEATLQQLQAQFDYTIITSPLSGVILLKNMEPGELANIGSPIVTIADLDNVTLKVYVPEPEIGKIKLGQDATVTVDSFPNKSFSGKI
ncbi:MAG: efflux RND transporter periplasmic adaptor subunit, partial [bacterium]|nr:efflux RND transporter periplasmic adaptor subunit [bacterium]